MNEILKFDMNRKRSIRDTGVPPEAASSNVQFRVPLPVWSSEAYKINTPEWLNT